MNFPPHVYENRSPTISYDEDWQSALMIRFAPGFQSGSQMSVREAFAEVQAARGGPARRHKAQAMNIAANCAVLAAPDQSAARRVKMATAAERQMAIHPRETA
ncbi:MAG TPA: hypothetical protein PLB97_09870 [Accumulibacter sp.]|nr:hypothetical protein [Accumulibacter sp.]HPP46730.1 hypothetical protein [Accumulibacter sp.]